MSHIHRPALLLTLLCAGLAGAAAASPPDPANCEVPDLTLLVSRGPEGGPDPIGAFTVVVRDFIQAPQPFADVVLDFRNCPDIRLCADQGDPSVLTDCATPSVRATAGQDGRVTFRVLGFAMNSGGSPGSIGPTLEVYADGVFLGAVRVAVLDQNGGGVNPEDLSLLLGDSFSGQAYARSDYDGNGVLDPNDVSIWLAAFFAGGSAVSGGAACP